MHCILMYRSDPEFLSETRLLQLLTEPLAREHSDVCEAMCDNVSAIRFFVSMSNSEWLGTCCEILSRLGDLSALQRCGFDTSIKGLTTSSPEVLDQDAMATKAFNLAASILKHRCSSMTWHSASWPGLTALLLSDREADVARGFDLLKQSRDAFLWASVGMPASREYAKRSMMNGEIMKLLCSMADEAGWKVVSPRLRRALLGIWGGFSQTLVVERSNKILREEETRSTNSKTISRMHRWQSLALSEVMKPFGFEPLKVSSHVVQDPDMCLDGLFEPGKKSSQWPDDITKDSSWATFSAQSVRRLYSEQHLMLAAHASGDESAFDDAWMSFFLLEKAVVIERAESTRGFYIVCILGSASLTWPIKVDGKYMHLETSRAKVSSLTWLTLSALETMYVVPFKVAGPKRTILDNTRHGIAMKADGVPTPLLDWHCSRGFAHVPAFAMRRLCEERGVPLPSSSLLVSGTTTEDALAVALVSSMKPSWNDRCVADALAKRKWFEVEDQTLDGAAIDPDAMDDCLLPGDRRDFAKALTDSKSVAAKAERRMEKSLALVKRVCPKVAKAKDPSDPGLTKHIASRKRKFGERWWAEITFAAEELRDLKPASCVVITDRPNGRFLVHHEAMPTQRKSISWTRRGVSVAVLETLKLLWAWERDVSGIDCPWPLHDDCA